MAGGFFFDDGCFRLDWCFFIISQFLFISLYQGNLRCFRYKHFLIKSTKEKSLAEMMPLTFFLYLLLFKIKDAVLQANFFSPYWLHFAFKKLI
jgi:hypothetical protein